MKLTPPGFKRPAGMTLTDPPDEKTQRPDAYWPGAEPFWALSVTPDVGSNTMPCCNWAVPPSVVQTVMGFPEASKSFSPNALVKSPLRQSLIEPTAVGGKSAEAE